MNPHLKTALRARLIAVTCYLAIIIIMPFFIFKNYPWNDKNQILIWTSLILWWAPLLIALPGMFKGKTYTYGWTGFIILLPFFYAFYYVTEPEKAQWAISIIVLSIIYFLASVSFVKKYALSLGVKTNKDAKKVKGIE